MTVSAERAIRAGGCFWGMQDLLRRYPGVLKKYPDGYTCHFIRPDWTLPHRQETGQAVAGADR
jgi:peptide-methionine (S)-S-oxide reductase